MDPEVVAAVLKGDFQPFANSVKEECRGVVTELVKKLKDKERDQLKRSLEGAEMLQATELLSLHKEGERYVIQNNYGLVTWVRAWWVERGSLEAEEVWESFIGQESVSFDLPHLKHRHGALLLKNGETCVSNKLEV